jgi:two-component system, cell cycle sensor histidine kinase and response regulator CckA
MTVQNPHRDPAFRAKLLDSVGQAVMATDPEGRLIYWNGAARQLYGWEADEVVGRLVTEVTPAPESVHEAERIMDDLREGKAWSGEFLVRGKDGRRVPVLVTNTPLMDEEGELVAIVGVSVDLSARRRLERRLQKSQRLEAVRVLAAGVAHDFNNSLTAIRGYADFLREALPPHHPNLADVDGIREAAERATRMTRQLLAFSRQQVLRPQTVDLGQLLDNWGEMIRTLVDSRIHVAIQLPREPVRIWTDPGQIEQVLIELVTNAQDAISGTGSVTVSVDELHPGADDRVRGPEMPPGRYGRLSVRDDGIGMEPEVLDRIFEPFFSTKAPEGGSGLGLSTAYGIVKQSQGFIYADSKPGEGTEVRVYLPISEATDQPEE